MDNTLKIRRRIDRPRASRRLNLIIRYRLIFCSECRGFYLAGQNFAAMMREIYGAAFCAVCWRNKRSSGGAV